MYTVLQPFIVICIIFFLIFYKFSVGHIFLLSKVNVDFSQYLPCMMLFDVTDTF